jgi:plasmid maintenance system antidote protein VapI
MTTKTLHQRDGLPTMTDTMAPRKAAMTPEEFVRLLAKAGKSQRDAVEILGYSLRQINRWTTGKSPIHEAIAAHLRSKLKKK